MPASITKFLNRKLFAIDGLTVTVAVVLVLVALYWYFFMRRK